MRHSSPGIRLLAIVLACLHLTWTFPIIAVGAAVTAGTEAGSVAIVSSVSGEAVVRHAEDPTKPNPASFKGPVVYGDRITTSKDATLGLLLGEKSLLTVLELSAVQIKQAGEGVRLVEMVNGKVCLATAKLKAGGAETTVVQTPTTTVTAQPGSLFQVEVQGGAGLSREGEWEPAGGARVFRAALTAQAGPMSAQAGGTPGTPLIETFTVIEGSIDIVSQAAGATTTPVRVSAGRAVRVTNGKIGEPFEAAPVTCRVQDVQQQPVHTSAPEGARQTIAQRESEQAGLLMAMVDKPPHPAGPLDEQIKVPGGLVLPTTRLYVPGGPGGTIPPPVFPAPGQPVLVFDSAVLDMGLPLVTVTDPPNTTNGPITLFEINSFSGNNNNVPIAFVGLNIFNLGEYRNPNNPEILQASIQVLSNPNVPVAVDHGVSFTNSSIAPAPGFGGPVVQVVDSQVTTTGTLIRLAGSQLTANDFLQLQNTNPAIVTSLTLNGTLLQAEAGSQVTVKGTFANVDPSAITTNAGLLALTGGSTLTTTGPFIDLVGAPGNPSTLTGNTVPIVSVNGGTLTLGSAGSPAGLARLTDSALTANAGLLSISGGGSVNSSGVLVSLLGTSALTATGATPLIAQSAAGSQLTLGASALSLSAAGQTATIAGDFLNVSGGQVTGPPAGSLVTASAGTVTVGGNLVTVGAGAIVNLGAASLVSTTGTGSVAVTGDLLNVAGTVSNSGAAAPVFSIGAGTNVTAGGGLLNLAGTGSLVLVSPLLELAGGATGAGATALLQVGAGSIADSAALASVTGTTTLNRPLLSVAGGSVNPSVGLLVGAPLTTGAGVPVFAVAGGTLSTTGALASATANLILGGNLLSQTGGTVTAGGLINASGGSTVTAGTSLLSAPAGTFAGTGTLMTLTNSTLTITSAVPALVATNGVTIANGGLLSATGSTIALGATNASLASVGPGAVTPSALVSVRGGVTLSAGATLINLSGTNLPIPNASPLVSVQGAGSQLTITGGDLLALRNGSALTGLGATQEILSVPVGATATIAGNLLTLDNVAFPARSAPLFVATDDPQRNVDVAIGGAVASLSNGSTLSTSAALVDVINTNNVGKVLSLGSFASLQSGSTMTIDDHLANISNSTVTLTGSNPAVSVNAATLNITNSNGGTDLVNLSDSTLTAPSGLLAVSNGGTVTINRNLLIMNPSTVNLTNGLLTLSGGSAVTVGRILADVPAGSTLAATGTLVTSNASTLNVNGAAAAVTVGNAGSPGATVSLTITNGGILSATGGAVTLAGLLTEVVGGNGSGTTGAGDGNPGGSGTLTAGATLVALSNGATLTRPDVRVTGGSGVGVLGGNNGGAGGSAALAITNGGLLSAGGGTVTSNQLALVAGGAGGAAGSNGGGNISGVGGNASLTATNTLISFTGGANLSSGATGQVIAVTGGSSGTSGGLGAAGGSAGVTIANGGLLSASGGTITLTNQLLSVIGGDGSNASGAGGAGGNATVTANATLVTLTNGATFTSQGIFVTGGAGGASGPPGAPGPPGAATLTVNNGGILAADGGQVTISSNFVTVNGTLTATGVLVSLSNMTGANPASFADHLIELSSPTLCNTPGLCSRAPGVLQATDVGAVASPITVGGSVLALDQMLFEATATFINLVRSHLQASNLVRLANNASYRSTNAADDFARLNASTINTTGALVNMAGGSFTHAGNLVSLANASALIAQTLALISGGSFNVGGALVALSGVGNTLTINANCGAACITFGVNVPILFQNGASLANTTVTIPTTYNAFTGSTAGNTLPSATQPLLIVDGPAPKSVKLGP